MESDVPQALTRVVPSEGHHFAFWRKSVALHVVGRNGPLRKKSQHAAEASAAEQHRCPHLRPPRDSDRLPVMEPAVAPRPAASQGRRPCAWTARAARGRFDTANVCSSHPFEDPLGVQVQGHQSHPILNLYLPRKLQTLGIALKISHRRTAVSKLTGAHRPFHAPSVSPALGLRITAHKCRGQRPKENKPEKAVWGRGPPGTEALGPLHELLWDQRAGTPSR